MKASNEIKKYPQVLFLFQALGRSESDRRDWSPSVRLTVPLVSQGRGESNGETAYTSLNVSPSRNTRRHGCNARRFAR